ncbi:MAG: ABC transporter permease [Longimicrobiales bacterium]
MRVLRNLALSVRALTKHGLRTALAAAAAAVGIAGVLVLTAVGEGARTEVVRRIERLGSNTLVIAAARVEPAGVRARTGDRLTNTLRSGDAEAILYGARGIVRAAPAQDREMLARWGRTSTPASILGTTSAWFAIRDFDMAAGRTFTAAESQTRARVAVLGADIRSSLFPDSADVVGRTIRIGRVPFVVIGVLRAKGVSVDGGTPEDDRIVIPLETAQRRLFNIDYLKMIYLEVGSAAAMASAEQAAGAILRARHDLPADQEDDFEILNPQRLLATELAAQRSLQRMVTGLGAMSLAVGATAILATMLLSVRERRVEIGLRITVGARRRDVATQFLVESMLIAVGGGLFGIPLGLGAAFLISGMTEWDVHASRSTIGMATLCVAGLGIVAGFLPAWRASCLQPIDALRPA